MTCVNGLPPFNPSGNPMESLTHAALQSALLEQKVRELELQNGLLHEYVGLLREELDSAVGMAYAHGWRSTPEKITEGKRLRDALGLMERIETSTQEKPKCVCGGVGLGVACEPGCPNYTEKRIDARTCCSLPFNHDGSCK